MSKITFDPERMDAAAAKLQKVRSHIESAARHVEQISVEGIKDPGLKAHLVATRRRTAMMTHGDADEVREVERRVRATAARARGADVPSKRPSRPQSKRRPRPGGKVRPGGKGRQRLPYPGHKASPQQMACWLASRAGGMGAPPELLVAAALVESGLQNLNRGDAASTGLFQIQVTIHPVPPGFGSASGTKQSKQWWTDHPEAQLKWFAAAVGRTDGPGRGPNTTGANAIGNWAADIERPAARFRGRYADRYDDAQRMVRKCPTGGKGGNGTGGAVAPGGSKRGELGARIESAARKMLGIEKRPEAFAKMQQRVQSGGRAAWCAAFAYSAVLGAGKRLPGTGWAAVRNWVQRAKARQSGLRIVSAKEAQPGDLVAFDWDGGSDYGQRAHIGVMDSEVSNGHFRTIEGNTGNGISATRRHDLNDAPNMVFIRVAA